VYSLTRGSQRPLFWAITIGCSKKKRLAIAVVDWVKGNGSNEQIFGANEQVSELRSARLLSARLYSDAEGRSLEYEVAAAR
jgi:hypothetical protein